MTTIHHWMDKTQPWERVEKWLDTAQDMSWVIDVHCREAKDKGFKSAVLYGDESNPSRIDFYTVVCPLITTPTAFVWVRGDLT
jgi:hypothetical protein